MTLFQRSLGRSHNIGLTVQGNLSKLNLVGTSFSIQNIQVKYTKIPKNEILIKVWYIQVSSSFRGQFRQVSLYNIKGFLISILISFTVFL